MGKTNLRKLLSIALSIVLLSSSFFIDANAIDTLYGIRYDYEESKEFDLNGQPSYKGYINVYGNATIKGENPLKDFNESMDDLHEIIDNPENKVTAATSTQVEFASKEDEAENTLRVEIDFAGDVLSQPLNIMFIMDQSGSLNMLSNANHVYTSPDMNPFHYYKTLVRLKVKDDIAGEIEMDYIYYHSPQSSKITQDWVKSNPVIEEYLRKYINENGLTLIDGKEVIDVVSVKDMNSRTPVYSSFTNEGFEKYKQGEDISINLSDCFYPSTSDNSKDLFEEVSTSVNTAYTYYSPEYFDNTNFRVYTSESDPTTIPNYSEYNAQEYIDNLIKNDLPYDRMLVSKILFKELSNIVIENNGTDIATSNKIGYVQFAGSIYEQRGLSVDAFPSEFTNIGGYSSTNYTLGFTTASTLITDVKDQDLLEGRNVKNLVIFVSDGAPSSSFTTTTVNNFINATDAIVYFAGIDLDQTIFNKYSEMIATKDSNTGDHLSANGTDLAGLMKITEDIKSLINAASVMSATVNENFVLRLDEDHAIELTYRKAGETESETIPIKDLPTNNKKIEVTNAAKELIGTLSYDETTQKISWNITHNNVNNARLSFYTTVNEEKVTWDEIATGGSFESIVLDNTDVFYINQDGFADSVEAADLGDILIEGNSQLRIENISSPATNPIFEVEDGYKTGVLVGSEITYTVKVKNEAIGRIVNAENLSILQKIPDNTTYVGHNYEARIYNKTDDTFKTIDISKAYDEDKNRILFSVDELKVDEWLEFEYRVKVTDEPNEEIVSYAQLGVLGQDNTFNPAEDEPYLQSLYLVHETYAQKPPHTSNPQTSYYLED